MNIFKNKVTYFYYRILNILLYKTLNFKLPYAIIIASSVILIFQLILKGPNLYPDSYDYLSYAGKISHLNFISPFAKRTPGYPVFIALIWTILGKGYFQIVIVQIGINFMSQLLLVKILHKTNSGNLIILSLLLYNLSPLSYISLNILTETLTIFLLLATILKLIEYLKEGKRTKIYLIVFLFIPINSYKATVYFCRCMCGTISSLH